MHPRACGPIGFPFKDHVETPVLLVAESAANDGEAVSPAQRSRSFRTGQKWMVLGRTPLDNVQCLWFSSSHKLGTIWQC